MKNIIPLEVKITVIITTFNRANYLNDAIQSVLDQSYKEFELIILDNDSEDDTFVEISKYKDKRIRYLKHEKMGISAQRNLGISEASGEFIAFLDDDDIWLPNKLLSQISHIQELPLIYSLIYGQYCYFTKAIQTKYYGSIIEEEALNKLLAEVDGFCGSASNPLIRKSALIDVGGYPEDVLSGEDYYLYLKLAKKFKFSHIPEPVLKIRQHDGPRLMHNLNGRIYLEEKIFHEFFTVMPKSTKVRLCKKIGGKYMRINKFYEGIKYLFRAFRYNPLDVELWAQIIASTFGSRFYATCHKLIIDLKKRNNYLPGRW